jgi:hypothetical protein
MKERGLGCDGRSRNGSPLTDREIANFRAAHATVSVQSNHLKNGSDNDVTKIQVKEISEHDKRRILIGENSPKVWYDGSAY